MNSLEKIKRLLDEFIKLELNMADLYLGFYHCFPADVQFWWGLALEEKNHASVLSFGKQMILDDLHFPNEFTPEILDSLIQKNKEIKFIIYDFQSNPFSRKAALNLALQLEESAGEIHFQKFMEKDETNSIAQMLKQLNKDDLDHAKRIQQYLEDNFSSQ